MGWFDEQIRQRKQRDEDVFSDAFIGIADAVLGTKTAGKDSRLVAKNEIDEILKYYHAAPRELPETVNSQEEQLEYLLRPHGIMHRKVHLEKGWRKDAIGAMLATRKEDGAVVALIPGWLSGYSYRDAASGKRVRVGKDAETLFETETVAFYRPFPLRSLSAADLFRYMAGTLCAADFLLFGLAALAVTLVGMLMPAVNKRIFSDVVENRNLRLLLASTVFLICINVSSILFLSVKQLLLARIRTKLMLSVQAASMMRILSLPAAFFKTYSSGELSARVQHIQTLCDMLVSSVLSTGLTALFSIVYITQIFAYAPALVVPALLVVAVTLAVAVLTACLQVKVGKRRMELEAKESGLSYALITGVQKIRLSGAEMRAFARWGGVYAKGAQLLYNPPLFLKLNTVIHTAISLVGTIIIYYMAVQSQVSVSDYYAFHTAYGMVSGAFLSLATLASTFAQIKPVLEMVQPLLAAEPEISEGKAVVSRLSGSIEINNISFRYKENMPLVVDNLSLKIRPGQYVAVVGATGCGKSTLMRLMLGFEVPQKGAVYYDGKDLANMDLKSLRQKIGVVMQNGKLFSGDLFSNITISAPWLTMDEAWQAAEMAGIADDIRRMPMGMHTMVSEGSGGVSGGQRQRLMIARAIAPKPQILMFDEATSALDNLTQKIVCESLDRLKCTRIVIAHRLSTIRQCDRILVLDGGRIVEDGTYDTLIAQNGRFAQLVARQRLDV